MDTNINESCKEASYEGVTLKFVKLKDANHGKRLDPIWSYFFVLLNLSTIDTLYSACTAVKLCQGACISCKNKS